MTCCCRPIWCFFCLLTMVGMDQLLPVQDFIGYPWKWIGAAVFIVGAALNLPQPPRSTAARSTSSRSAIQKPW